MSHTIIIKILVASFNYNRGSWELWRSSLMFKTKLLIILEILGNEKLKNCYFSKNVLFLIIIEKFENFYDLRELIEKFSLYY